MDELDVIDKMDAIDRIEDLLANIEEQAEELAELFRNHFPEHYKRGEAYNVFNLTGSWNKYDITVDTLFRDIKEEATA